jgi:hypothetical protein
VTFFVTFRPHDLAVFDGNPRHHWGSAWVDMLAYLSHTPHQTPSHTLNKRSITHAEQTLTMFYTFLNPSHPIGTVAASFAGGMFGINVGKSVKKLDKLNYSYIMFSKQASKQATC